MAKIRQEHLSPKFSEDLIVAELKKKELLVAELQKRYTDSKNLNARIMKVLEKHGLAKEIAGIKVKNNSYCTVRKNEGYDDDF